MSVSGHTERIFVRDGTGVRLFCECSWKSGTFGSHAQALRAYVEHLPRPDANDVAESIIAGTPAHLLPRPQQQEAVPSREQGTDLQSKERALHGSAPAE